MSPCNIILCEHVDVFSSVWDWLCVQLKLMKKFKANEIFVGPINYLNYFQDLHKWHSRLSIMTRKKVV